MTLGIKDLRFAIKGIKIKSKEKENISKNVLTVDIWNEAVSRVKLTDPACRNGAFHPLKKHFFILLRFWLLLWRSH